MRPGAKMRPGAAGAHPPGLGSAPGRPQVREFPATAPQTVENERPSGSGSTESTISLGSFPEICVGIAPLPAGVVRSPLSRHILGPISRDRAYCAT